SWQRVRGPDRGQAAVRGSRPRAHGRARDSDAAVERKRLRRQYSRVAARWREYESRLSGKSSRNHFLSHREFREDADFSAGTGGPRHPFRRPRRRFSALRVIPPDSGRGAARRDSARIAPVRYPVRVHLREYYKAFGIDWTKE